MWRYYLPTRVAIRARGHIYPKQNQLQRSKWSCGNQTRLPRKVTSCKFSKEWRAQGDDFRTFLSDFVASLTQAKFPDGFGL
jgi:hypothetical protein